MTDQTCYDKRGIPIERGDIVKVFHFIGARRKRHYMYKQCLGVDRYPSSPEGFDWTNSWGGHYTAKKTAEGNAENAKKELARRAANKEVGLVGGKIGDSLKIATPEA